MDNESPSISELEFPSPGRTRMIPARLVDTLRLFLTVSFPVVLVLTSVRLVATETFVRLEYGRPGFPEDRYGFTPEERLKYAPYAVQYMTNDADIGYLGDLALENGDPLYSDRELKHMEDVKIVAQVAFTVQAILGVFFGAAIITLAWKPETRQALRRGLFGGGVFTVFLIITLVVLMVANWDFFFTGFHTVFFEGDSWQFSTSDTLIRLFPEQFWFDAAISIGLVTIIGTGATMVGAWLWERRSAEPQNQNGATSDPIGETAPQEPH